MPLVPIPTSAVCVRVDLVSQAVKGLKDALAIAVAAKDAAAADADLARQNLLTVQVRIDRGVCVCKDKPQPCIAARHHSDGKHDKTSAT